MPLETAAQTPQAAPEPQIYMDHPFTGTAALAVPASPPASPPAGDSGAGAHAPPAPPTQPDFTQSEYYTQAKGLGLPLDGISDEKSLLKAALAAYQVERPYAQHARASLSQAVPSVNKDVNAEGHEKKAHTDKQEGDTAFDPDAHFSSLWSAPTFDANAKFAIEKGLVQLDDNGLYVPTPGPFEAQMLPIISSLNQTHHAQREQLRNFFEGNPFQKMAQALEPYFEHKFSAKFSKDFQDITEGSLKSYEEDAFVTKWEADNAS